MSWEKCVGAVVLAGGKGERFRGQKQFCELKGKPLWQHVNDKIHAVMQSDNIIVVGIDIPGGETRTESVRDRKSTRLNSSHP